MLNKISLNEFIAQVKKDLLPTEDLPIFFLEKAELEINVAVAQEDSSEDQWQGKAGLNISVLGVNFLNLGELQAGEKASHNLKRQDIHTIKVTLLPIFTREEIKTDLNDEEIRKIKWGVKRRIMRGEPEENSSNFRDNEPDQTIKNKIMRG
ncbi:hypothetical protein H6G74_27340 [Nostoc spongiaeforme FACHB-130]|uniref:Trypsin-co-occurring domain-containing protein n=1 Tax=Nostoc spongiaeforme FACHB-130 TaxID=1357510 RepID=A0ABR8G451_9NOSO|nr:trypco2 family protein [Nostoc spongiaeforme]MBD2598010.1 hypothetical protein [Nostoc spongiaeforme FACHB-130]